MILLVRYDYPKNRKVVVEHYAANDSEKLEKIKNYSRKSKAIGYEIIEEKIS